MKTFEAIIDGDRIRWASEDPHLTRPTPVTVEITETIELTDGQSFADYLDQVVRERGGVTSFGDPAKWEREQRDDREMPGRSE